MLIGKEVGIPNHKVEYGQMSWLGHIYMSSEVTTCLLISLLIPAPGRHVELYG